MKHRLILHCDANNFFASVEQITNVNLKDKAIAVTGDVKKRNGIVLAKNELAKKFGIKTGDTVWQAKQKCPDVVCVPPHMELYEEYSYKLMEIYESFTDYVEPFSIDECFLDITSTAKFFGTAEQVANLIKEKVKENLGITISVGVSFCKLFAKLGSDMKKPDAVTCIPECSFKKMIYPLPVGELCGIGRRTEIKLKKLGVNQLGDIITIPDDILSSHFGIIGTNLKLKLLGFDSEPVKRMDEKYIPKSVGNGTTTLIDIKHKQDILSVISFLCEQITTRLRNKHLVSNRITICLRLSDLSWTDCSRTFFSPTNTAKDIFNEAIKTLESFWDYTKQIRAIRICCSNLSDEKCLNQITFFDENNKKQTLNIAIDKVREKYGYTTIMPCNTNRENIISDTALQVKQKNLKDTNQ